MKTLKYTKDAWDVDGRYVRTHKQEPLISHTICEIYGNDEESKGNAQLIKWAPTMLNDLIELAAELHYESLYVRIEEITGIRYTFYQMSKLANQIKNKRLNDAKNSN